MALVNKQEEESKSQSVSAPNRFFSQQSNRNERSSDQQLNDPQEADTDPEENAISDPLAGSVRFHSVRKALDFFENLFPEINELTFLKDHSLRKHYKLMASKLASTPFVVFCNDLFAYGLLVARCGVILEDFDEDDPLSILKTILLAGKQGTGKSRIMTQTKKSLLGAQAMLIRHIQYGTHLFQYYEKTLAKLHAAKKLAAKRRRQKNGGNSNNLNQAGGNNNVEGDGNGGANGGGNDGEELYSSAGENEEEEQDENEDDEPEEDDQNEEDYKDQSLNESDLNVSGISSISANHNQVLRNELENNQLFVVLDDGDEENNVADNNGEDEDGDVEMSVGPAVPTSAGKMDGLTNLDLAYNRWRFLALLYKNRGAVGKLILEFAGDRQKALLISIVLDVNGWGATFCYEFVKKAKELANAGDTMGAQFLISIGDSHLDGMRYSTAKKSTPSLSNVATAMIAACTPSAAQQLVEKGAEQGVVRRVFLSYSPRWYPSMLDQVDMGAMKIPKALNTYRMFCVWRFVVMNVDNGKFRTLRKKPPAFRVGLASPLNALKVQYMRNHPNDQRLNNFVYPAELTDSNGDVIRSKLSMNDLYFEHKRLRSEGGVYENDTDEALASEWVVRWIGLSAILTVIKKMFAIKEVDQVVNWENEWHLDPECAEEAEELLKIFDLFARVLDRVDVNPTNGKKGKRKQGANDEDAPQQSVNQDVVQDLKNKIVDLMAKTMNPTTTSALIRKKLNHKKYNGLPRSATVKEVVSKFEEKGLISTKLKPNKNNKWSADLRKLKLTQVAKEWDDARKKEIVKFLKSFELKIENWTVGEYSESMALMQWNHLK